MNLSNNCDVHLTAGYATLSGVIISDNTIDISNGCVFGGSGQTGSYIIVLDDKNDPTGQVMDVSNNTTAAIYYASAGRIHLNNNAAAKQLTAYGIDLDNNATITYESGLADVTFTSGPSGGYEVDHWKEVP